MDDLRNEILEEMHRKRFSLGVIEISDAITIVMKILGTPMRVSGFYDNDGEWCFSTGGLDNNHTHYANVICVKSIPKGELECNHEFEVEVTEIGCYPNSTMIKFKPEDCPKCGKKLKED